MSPPQYFNRVSGCGLLKPPKNPNLLNLVLGELYSLRMAKRLASLVVIGNSYPNTDSEQKHDRSALPYTIVE